MPTTTINASPIALCYLGRINDEKNVCHLYRDYLLVTHKGKKNTFNRDTLQDVNVKHKKLLFPLISGGIIGSFFLISAFNFSINIWVSLTFTCVGFISLYFGWTGTSTFSVTTSIKEYDFFLYQVSKPVIAFSQFIKEYIITNNSDGIYFYLPFSTEEWKNAMNAHEVMIDKKTYLFNSQQIKMHGIRSYLKIDTSKTENPILVDTEHSNMSIAPYITHAINITAVEWVNI